MGNWDKTNTVHVCIVLAVDVFEWVGKRIFKKNRHMINTFFPRKYRTFLIERSTIFCTFCRTFAKDSTHSGTRICLPIALIVFARMVGFSCPHCSRFWWVGHNIGALHRVLLLVHPYACRLRRLCTSSSRALKSKNVVRPCAAFATI